MPDNPLLAEVYQMLDQYNEPYMYGSLTFNQTYDFTLTPYTEDMRHATEAFKLI